LRPETIHEANLRRYLVAALKSIHPAAPVIFGLDGEEVGPDEVILKVRSRVGDGLQAYFIVCHVLRVAANMVYRDLGQDALPRLLRLQELAGP